MFINEKQTDTLAHRKCYIEKNIKKKKTVWLRSCSFFFFFIYLVYLYTCMPWIVCVVCFFLYLFIFVSFYLIFLFYFFSICNVCIFVIILHKKFIKLVLNWICRRNELEIVSGSKKKKKQNRQRKIHIEKWFCVRFVFVIYKFSQNDRSEYLHFTSLTRKWSKTEIIDFFKKNINDKMIISSSSIIQMSPDSFANQNSTEISFLHFQRIWNIYADLFL